MEQRTKPSSQNLYSLGPHKQKEQALAEGASRPEFANFRLSEILDPPALKLAASIPNQRPVLSYDPEGHLEPSSRQALREFHPEIVLFAPQIAQNAGTVARLAAAFCCHLHFIKPLGFDITEKAFRRPGLDYWAYVKFSIHESWDEFCAVRPEHRYVFVETGSKDTPQSFAFSPGDLLIFGPEPCGLPDDVLQRPLSRKLHIPMFETRVRSLNLANAVSIVVQAAVSKIGY